MFPRRTKLAQTVLTREVNLGECYLSKMAERAGRKPATAYANRSQASTGISSSGEKRDWVPHPHNGIYFPQGHEWVMEDVPHDAALPGKIYWLRNIDGVDKADHDLPSDHYLHYTM